MRQLELANSGAIKLLKSELELTEKDISNLPGGILPGEWVLLVDKERKTNFLAYINPHSTQYQKIKVISKIDVEAKSIKNDNDFILDRIKANIESAISKRKIFKKYDEGSRLVYGPSDFLPGLIVDKYKKYIFVQINTAGLDKFRQEIKQIFESNFPSHLTVLFDNLEYRKAEVLPVYGSDNIESNIEVIENGINYLLTRERIQKIGFYYDHRENREKLRNKINEIRIDKNAGLDLFSYVGAWGLHMLSAGVEHVTFVDAADMTESISANLNLNNFQNRGTFIRSDVFKFLDDAISKNIEFDIVVSDPPAFTKSEKNKDSAMAGYEKLHTKALKLVKNKGLFVAASCTHYVNMDELDKTVQTAAWKSGAKVQLLDVGIQGHDHVVKGFSDKGFYIKYILYQVERGR